MKDQDPAEGLKESLEELHEVVRQLGEALRPAIERVTQVMGIARKDEEVMQDRKADPEEIGGAADKQAQAIKPFFDYLREELGLGEVFFVESIVTVPETHDGRYVTTIRFKVME